MELLRKGSRGPEVKKLQKALDLIDDGIFGRLTDEAVRSFQSANNLSVDGIVGPRTWEKLKGYNRQEAEINHFLGFKLRKTNRKVNAIILHCTATQEGKDVSVQTLRKWHTDPVSKGGQGWSDIGYHYIIYRDGTICEGRDIDKVGAHCKGYNTGSIGIVYVGGCAASPDPNGKYPAKDTRTDAQKQSLSLLVGVLCRMYGLNRGQVFAHYQFANKACPSFNIESFRKEIPNV